MRILTDDQEDLLKDSRSLLNELRASMIQFGAAGEDQETLAHSISQLDELFLDVFVQAQTMAKGKVKLIMDGVDEAAVVGDPDRLKQLYR